MAASESAADIVLSAENVLSAIILVKIGGVRWTLAANKTMSAADFDVAGGAVSRSKPVPIMSAVYKVRHGKRHILSKTYVYTSKRF